MLNSVAVIAAHGLPVGKYMPGDGAGAPVLEADRLIPVVKTALDKAGIQVSEIDSAIFTGNPPPTRQKGFPAYMSARLGLCCGTQLAEVSAMGVTGGSALDVAAADIMLGRSRYAMALGLCYQANEKPYVAMERGISVVGDVDFQAPFGLTPISWYAMGASRYMYETGVSRADIAQVAVKSRRFAANNPLAQFRESLTINEVLDADLIIDPLGRYEVPAQADGAICLILTSTAIAQESGLSYIELVSRGFGHDGRHQVGDTPHDMLDLPAARIAVNACLDEAELKLKDIDVLELYAPCTITEILVSESVGLCERGQGAHQVAAGVTGPNGDRPINTSGGCLARGHPPSLTGLYQALECFEQLTDSAGGRQINANYALSLCESGYYNFALAHLFRRCRS